MIITEGMDGTGKSTLIRSLSRDLNIPVHDKASTSLGGPVDNIYDWAKQDIESWGTQPLSIYDRHPMISEMIYGPIARGSLDKRFLEPEASTLLKTMYEKSVIVLCAPPWHLVNKNLNQEPQPNWVWANAEALYEEYAHLLATIPLSANLVVYDYTQTRSYERLADSIVRHFKKGSIFE